MAYGAPQRVALEAGLDHIRCSPRDQGTLDLIVRRPTENDREVLEEALLDCEEGLVGDNWRVRGSRHTPDGSALLEQQLTVMNARVASLVAVDPERRALCGDQFHVDLDLSKENLPPGTHLALGSAVIVVSARPHLGCWKFDTRFGRDAFTFVNSPMARELRLRGLNATVVVGGTVRRGVVVRRV